MSKIKYIEKVLKDYNVTKAKLNIIPNEIERLELLEGDQSEIDKLRLNYKNLKYQIEKINYSLDILNDVERKVITEYYFNHKKYKDIKVYTDIYQIKRNALNKLIEVYYL